MKMRKFVANSMSEAIGMVKSQLGPDAIIVSTRTIKSGLSGIKGDSKVEVTVAEGRGDIALPVARKRYGSLAGYEEDRSAGLPEMAELVQDVRGIGHELKNLDDGKEPGAYQQDLNRIMNEIKEMKKSISLISGGSPGAEEDMLKQIQGMKKTIGGLTGNDGRDSESLLVQELQNIKQFMDVISTRQDDSQLVNYVSKELRSLKERTESLIKNSRMQKELISNVDVNELLQRLLLSGVSESYALDLIEELDADLQSRHLAASRYGKDCLAGILMNRVKVSGPLWTEPKERRVMALVGPTGVGKTTTIAKLAAEQVFERKRKVALITVDTFRIGAVDQLKTYAKIISAPCDVAYSEKEFRNLLDIHRDMEVILVDTVGMNQKDLTTIEHLKMLFTGEIPVESHLIVSATTGERDARDVVEKFGSLPLKSLIISKIDETTAFGSMFNMVQKFDYPLSYFTVGQNVPDDIEIATPERVASLLLNITTN